MRHNTVLTLVGAIRVAEAMPESITPQVKNHAGQPTPGDYAARVGAGNVGSSGRSPMCRQSSRPPLGGEAEGRYQHDLGAIL